MTGSDLLSLQIRIAQASDQAAFRELYHLFYKPLCFFAAAFLGSANQSEEIVNDVFIKIWQNRVSLAGINNLRVYLYNATRNTSLNYIKSLQRFRVEEITEVVLNFGHNVHTPEDYLLSSEMVSRVNSALQSLPPRCKLIFKMVKEDGLKYREVAAILDVSQKTVEAQMTLALKRVGEAVNVQLK